jgi:hypothetical protein
LLNWGIAPSLEVDTVDVEGEDEYVDREYALCKMGLETLVDV